TAALTSAFNEWVPVTNENKACLSSMLAKRNVAEKQRQKSALNAFKANVQKRKEARVILRSRLEAVERRGLTHGFTLWKKFNEHERTASGPLTSVDETPFSIESGLVTDTSAEEHMKGTDLLAGFDVVEKAEAASKLEDAAVSLEPVLGASGVIEAADSGRPAFTQKIKCKRTRPVFDELKRHVVLQHKKRIAQAMGQKHRTAQAFREWSQRAVRRVARNQVVVAMNALRNTKSKKEVFQALRRNTQEEKAKKTPVDIPHVGAPKVQPSVIQNTQVKPLSPQGPKRKKRDEAVVVEKAHLPTITEETTLSSYSSLSSRSESPTTIAALHPVTKEVVCDRTSTLPVKQRAVSPTKDYSSWLLGGGAAFIAAGVALLSGKRTAQGRLGVVVDALRSDSRLTFGEKVRALAGALALGAGVTLGSVGAYQKIAR
ncbi:MAG: hypothetical protein QG632_439, partial [Candidatus Dependentiae bacterium]|nr:hypothetical protein [Candidatus Dependentiae bacterium]